MFVIKAIGVMLFLWMIGLVAYVVVSMFSGYASMM